MPIQPALLHHIRNSENCYKFHCAAALLFTGLLLVSCGGGGGSGPTNATGDLVLQVEKDELDSDEFTRVRVDAFDINKEGVILKFHYPRSIKYSRGSATLRPNEDGNTSFDPFTEATSGPDRYLVFFIKPENAEGDDDITLEFDLKAIEEDPEAFVEVDLDNNDPNIADSREFEADDARFSALDHRDIEIRDDSTLRPTPTPTATPST